jgi:RNA-dependent RNA polymerase
LEVQIPGQQIPCRQQNEERTTASVVADLMDVDGKEVEGSPRGWIWISADGLQNHQSPSSTVYSSVSNRERDEAGYLEYQMPNDPARDLTLSPVADITMRVQQMDGLSGRLGVATPPSLPTGNALSASPQMLALGELEFDRRFLIFVYLAE